MLCPWQSVTEPDTAVRSILNVPSDNIRVAVTAFLYTNTEPVACVTSAVDHGGRCIKVECCNCYAKCAGEEMMVHLQFGPMAAQHVMQSRNRGGMLTRLRRQFGSRQNVR
jgi:hypothetical protein